MCMCVCECVCVCMCVCVITWCRPALMCSGELVVWPLISGLHFVYERFTTQMFAFHNNKAANREECHVVIS